MEIYSEQMELLIDADTDLGWLENTERIVKHAAVEAVAEKWHYEIAAEYPNGGRDVIRVTDVPGIEAKDAWEERIPIQIYHPYTQEELEQIRKEAEKIPLEERVARAEKAIELLRGTLETTAKRWADFLEARGEG